MKKKVIRLLFLLIVLCSASFAVSAQIYVRVRPVAPVSVRIAQPSPAHVWIGEEWAPNGHGYRYTGGRWAVPPHRGYYRRPGHWRRHNQDGEVWVPGSWARR